MQGTAFFPLKRLQIMLAKKSQTSADLFRSRLSNLLDMNHVLCKLAREIDWAAFDSEFSCLYSKSMGRPGKELRLMVGIHYLKHAFNESDESVVDRWLENPYWQWFCGYEYFQHDFPLHPTSLVKWRKRIGKERMSVLLAALLDVAKNRGQLSKCEMAHVNVDTTVQEKNITFPTDGNLYYKMLKRLVASAHSRNISLRQGYPRVSKIALIMQGRYRHARQFKRAKRMLKKLKTFLGRVVRDIERKCKTPDEDLLKSISMAKRLLAQKRKSKNKLYSLHAPEVECISKGKAHKRYEFGCKVSVVSTSRHNWLVGVLAHHENPYDGHTLADALLAMEHVTGMTAAHAHVDKGYQGHGYLGETEIHLPGKGHKSRKGSGQSQQHSCKQSRAERKWQKRRAAVEPVIGHMKNDNRMDRNYLLGKDGDHINAILSACGYNFRKLLKLLFGQILWQLLREFGIQISSNEQITSQINVQQRWQGQAWGNIAAF